MKRLGTRKWLLATSALVGLLIVLSLGLVACGSDTDDVGAAGDWRSAERSQALADRQGSGAVGAQASAADRREGVRDRIQDRREAVAERREALLDNLRDEMTAEDQARLDELRGDIEEQRDNLEKDRRELADTLRELRELTQKYLGPNRESDQSEG